MLTLFLMGTAAVVLVMLLLWLLGLKQLNFSYVDLGWSANFVLLAVINGVLGEGDGLRRALICGMYALWGARLALHLASRIIGEPEEGRYVQLRADWGVTGNVNLKFLGFFQFQALLNIVLGLPMLLAVSNATPALHWLEMLGLLVWVIGLVGESIADAQLKTFKRNATNKGRVCNVGLWGWSRHPNYFFEWTIWIGYALFALASPYGWLCLALPVLMLHFLLNVTGVKATEEQAVRSKGEAYLEYQRTVSAFVPLPPKQPHKKERV
jgi:steroid 5-alpha reductase family enzyme